MIERNCRDDSANKVGRSGSERRGQRDGGK